MVKKKKKFKNQTRSVLEASEAAVDGLPWCDGAEDERQSATARRKGSGGFLRDEDLNLETLKPPPANWNLELAGLLDGLKLVDIDKIKSQYIYI